MSFQTAFFLKLKQTKMLKLFKTTALLEGVSSILLFFFAMPMKYLMDDKQFIRPIGMAHGVLFMAFVALAIYFAVKEKWDFKKAAIIFLCAFIPFGTFYVDKKYLKNA
jgi:integral membrane protein